MEALQLEQQTLRDTVTELTTTKAKIGGGASTYEPSARADNKDNNLHLAHTVALANQLQVPYLKP